MARIVFHRPHLGRGAQRIRDALRRALVIRRKGHAHMAIIEDRIVGSISLLDLIERLRDQKALETVARHERQC